jgi:hypothetical protein
MNSQMNNYTPSSLVKKAIAKAVIGALLVNTTSAFAYGTWTHVAMTAFAFNQAQIMQMNSGVIDQLGLTELLALSQDAPFRASQQVCVSNQGTSDHCYVSFGLSAVWRDGDDKFAHDIINDTRVAAGNYPSYKPVIQGDHTLTGWLMRGAVREDDNDIENAASDDPGGVFSRPFGHFYDPYVDRGLTIASVTVNGKTYGGISPGAKASDWALTGGTTIWSDASLSHTARTNSYNLPALREAYWRALTGTTNDGKDITPNNTPAGMSKTNIRKGYWATTFRALGDLVHLLQDMAQPQHTRNDAHSGAGCIQGTNVCLAGHDSFYEKYITARTLGNPTFSLSEGFNPKNTTTVASPNTNNLNQLDFTSYSKIPRFDNIRAYYSTAIGQDSVASGQGLANYSNRGFYSFGTNIGSTGTYPSPDPSGLGLSPLIITSGLVDSGGNPVTGAVTYMVGNVNDTLTGSSDSAKLTTYGAWDQFLKQGKRDFTLNYMNYDDQVRLLVPRAVAYSTGLIDYFFRGKMQISLPDAGVYGLVDHYVENQKDTSGFRKIKLKIQNLTQNSSGGIVGTSTSGKLVAVAKFHRNNCYTPTLSGEYGSPAVDWQTCRSTDEDIVTSDQIAAPAGMDSSPQEVAFMFQAPIPINATDLSLQVVYRGPAGDPTNPDEADTIFVATKDISEPHYLYNYSRWDQYTYKSYWPIVDSPGTISYQNWCLGGTSPAFPNIAACNQAMGSTIKVQYRATTAPISGYDPNNPSATSDPADPSLTPGTWHSLSKELPLQPVAVMTAPIGTLARVAVLTEAQPTNTAMWIEELVDSTHNSANFQWNSGAAVTTTNQQNLSDGKLTPSVTYISGRGVYMPSGENLLLNSGDANPMPQLQLAPSQINF